MGGTCGRSRFAGISSKQKIMSEKLDALIVKAQRDAEALDKAVDRYDKSRAAIQAELKAEGRDGYKNGVATVSIVTRKKVEIKDETALMDTLRSQSIVKYFKTVPAHEELLPKFTEDVKEGRYSHPAVSVEATESIKLTFGK